MLNDIEKKDKRSFGNLVGQIVAIIFIGCATSIVVALTIKLISWILGL